MKVLFLMIGSIARASLWMWKWMNIILGLSLFNVFFICLIITLAQSLPNSFKLYTLPRFSVSTLNFEYILSVFQSVISTSLMKRYSVFTISHIFYLVFMFYVFRRAPRPALFLKVKSAPCFLLKVKIAPCPFLEDKNAPCLFSEMKNNPCSFSTISGARKLNSCWKSENAT